MEVEETKEENNGKIEQETKNLPIQKKPQNLFPNKQLNKNRPLNNIKNNFVHQNSANNQKKDDLNEENQPSLEHQKGKKNILDRIKKPKKISVNPPKEFKSNLLRPPIKKPEKVVIGKKTKTDGFPQKIMFFC